MKNKKILILLVLSFILCGCDVKYNININGNSISEKIIIPNDNNYTKDDIKDNFYYDVNNNKKYNLNIKNNEIILTNRKTNLNTIANNDLYSLCYDKIEAYEEDGIYYIGTSDEFKCMSYEYIDVDSITINIKTYNKVEKHNADKVLFNTYTWIIDDTNYDNKNILFIVNKKEYKWYYRFKGLIFGISGVLLLYIVLLLIKKLFIDKSDKINKI